MQLLTPMFPPPPLRVAVSLGVAASLAFWLSPLAADSAVPEASAAASTALPDRAWHAYLEPPPTNLAELRAGGPAVFDAMVAHYWQLMMMNTGPDPGWERAVEQVAGQRYATWSQLYWYTDLDLAEREAQRLHRPILALRMLGDLRDDLSCANSRLFRATLYGNHEVSKFLRDNFVLYWSSERPVPTVTIDFHDGRKLVRTTTGNSAHYVLDEAGHVLDVLPGLYAPSVFRTELTKSLGLARHVRGMTDEARVNATVAYHAAAAAATDRLWHDVQRIRYLKGSRYLVGSGGLARAQATTASKAMIELPDLAMIGLLRASDVPDDTAAWSAVGQKVWNIAGRDTRQPPPVQGASPPPSMVLDDQSRNLVEMIRAEGLNVEPPDAAETAVVIARLEHHIVADTAINELRLRPMIHRRIAAQGVTDFATLNAWIYEEVFATPASDPWLGLLTRTDFSGLPGDGVVMH